MPKVLIAIAARLTLLQAAFLALALLLMLAGSGPSRTALGTEWPLSGLLMLTCLAGITYGGFAMMKPYLWGAGVPAWPAALNVSTVALAAVVNAAALLSYATNHPSQLTYPTGLVVLLYVAVSLLVLAGALLAIWTSWRAQRAGSITA